MTGSGVPTSGFVYKLVSRAGDDGQMVSVAKKSADKVSVGGRKQPVRRLKDGVAQAEVIGIGAEPRHDADDRPLLVELWRDGERVHHDTLDDARARLRSALAELPASARQLSKADPVLETIYEELS